MSFYFPFEKFPSTKFFQNVADLEKIKCCRNNEVRTEEFLKRGFFLNRNIQLEIYKYEGSKI